MSGEQDKGGADAGQDVNVTVHDYDPVRPAPPKKSKARGAVTSDDDTKDLVVEDERAEGDE